MFLYEKGTIYRDIKPPSIPLQCVNPLHVRLADFRISKIIEKTTGATNRTGHYIALEMRGGHTYTKKVDVYAVG